MKKCNIPSGLCPNRNIAGFCQISEKCEYLTDDQCNELAKMCEIIRNSKPGRAVEVSPTNFTRIADALEKIAKELERQNELKAIEIKMGSIPAYRDEHDGDELAKMIQSDVNKIMED